MSKDKKSGGRKPYHLVAVSTPSPAKPGSSEAEIFIEDRMKERDNSAGKIRRNRSFYSSRHNLLQQHLNHARILRKAERASSAGKIKRYRTRQQQLSLLHIATHKHDLKKQQTLHLQECMQLLEDHQRERTSSAHKIKRYRTRNQQLLCAIMQDRQQERASSAGRIKHYRTRHQKLSSVLIDKHKHDLENQKTLHRRELERLSEDHQYVRKQNLRHLIILYTILGLAALLLLLALFSGFGRPE